MIISLTGYMGSGKSCVGEELAGLLGYPFIDLDEYVAHKKGCAIPEIIKNEGEDAFRALEAECVRDIIIMRELTGEDLVLALGGGTLTINSVRDFILTKTKCVYLRATFETIVGRIGSALSSRPLFSQSSYLKRLPVYEISGYAVDTDGKTPQSVAREIKNFSVYL